VSISCTDSCKKLRFSGFVGPIVSTKGKTFFGFNWISHRIGHNDVLLQESVHEIDTLLQQGFNYHGRLISVNLKCIVCDAPAKAMVKGVKLFSGYYGCDRCNQTGVWCGRITYQDIGNLQLRTDHLINWKLIDHVYI
jgi:hypothetical protein